MNIPDKTPERISKWIKERVRKAGAKGLVLGLSGGLDSSVTAVLCRNALGNNVLGLIMPCHSDPRDSEHAMLIAKKFNIKTERTDLTPAYDSLLSLLPRGTALPRANLKPRLRMLTLYYFANLKGYLVVGAGNKTELSTGYFTKHGDSGADILPLGDLYKTQVRLLAGELGIPEEITSKPPSAGLWQGQTDEQELGITYQELDKTLESLEKNQGAPDQELTSRVRKMIEKSSHKREAPPICRL